MQWIMDHGLEEGSILRFSYEGKDAECMFRERSFHWSCLLPLEGENTVVEIFICAVLGTFPLSCGFTLITVLRYLY